MFLLKHILIASLAHKTPRKSFQRGEAMSERARESNFLGENRKNDYFTSGDSPKTMKFKGSGKTND